MEKTVALLGASPDPARYAHRAFRLLVERGYPCLLVNPKVREIEGQGVFPSLREIRQPVDTLTLYVGPAISAGLVPEIVGLRPRRVIFNPGTENPSLEKALEEAGIQVVIDCTLVMLRAGRF